MSELSFPPFIKWGDYKSTDKDNPDKLELKVIDTATTETEFSTNSPVQLKKEKGWTNMILPLKSRSSNNPSLLNQWKHLADKGSLRKGGKATIKTWLSTSKNGRPIRRYLLEV